MNPNDKAKTINGLMIHLRDDCKIDIGGSKDKLQLTQYGYYHEYKGYRFIKQRSNTIEDLHNLLQRYILYIRIEAYVCGLR